jgi:hypothetical protein
MSSRTLLFRLALLLFLALVLVPGVSAWTLRSMSITPTLTELPPGSPVTASCTLQFDSWMSGTTFEKDNSLLMYTDLTSPQWVVKKVEAVDGQTPITEEIPVRQAAQVRLDGWSLSYSRKQFDLTVQLTGKTPALNQTANISVVKLQEMAPGSKTVPGSLIKREIRVLIPTPVPTYTPAEVTINMTPAEVIEVTPLPEVLSTPTKKVTYAPGPEPLLVAGVLAVLAGIAAVSGRKD